MNPAPGAEEAARAAFRELALAEAKAARALATIEHCRAYVRHGFGSVQSWAESVGYGPMQTARLLALGRALREVPGLAAKVRSGRVVAEAAISVGRVLREPTLDLSAEERQKWIDHAETAPPQALRAEASKAIEEGRQGRPTCGLRLHVTLDARDGFWRARRLMSRGHRRGLSEGQTFGRLVEEWLAGNDPQRKPLPQRRAGPTAGNPSRRIPARTRALVERRSGGNCEICRHRRAVEKIHIRTPHAKGGGREVEDLADGCRECHVLFDARVFRYAGDDDGRLQFTFHPDMLGESGGPTRVREPPSRPYGADLVAACYTFSVSYG